MASLTHAMTGGVKVGGVATVAVVELNIHDIALDGMPFGGMTMGGAALIQEAIQYVPQGGMVMGGGALIQDNIPFIPTGGMVMGGTISLAYVSVPVATGGMVMSGTLAHAYVSVPVASGGMVMGGAAIEDFRESLFDPSGGMRMGGSAIAFFVPAGTVLTTENPYGEPFPGWALNLETMAPSRYLGLVANSMTQFKGKTFVANAGGIYEVGADDDAGLPIKASIQFPTTDYGRSNIKSMEVAYIGVRTQGKMKLKMFVNRDHPHYYHIAQNLSTPKGTRVVIGKGMRGRYWGARLDNVDGTDFELESVEFNPVAGQRHGA